MDHAGLGGKQLPLQAPCVRLVVASK
jgi:hypothetical protein